MTRRGLVLLLLLLLLLLLSTAPASQKEAIAKGEKPLVAAK